MTKREASRETLERLAEAVNAGFESAAAHHYEAVKFALLAYRAEITPPLRTRAEVDAEIVHYIRGEWFNGGRPVGLADHTRANLRRLCAEPTAPEGESRTDPGVYEWSRVTPELWANLAHECCADDKWALMRIELLQAIHAVQAAAKGRL